MKHSKVRFLSSPRGVNSTVIYEPVRICNRVIEIVLSISAAANIRVTLTLHLSDVTETLVHMICRNDIFSREAVAYETLTFRVTMNIL